MFDRENERTTMVINAMIPTKRRANRKVMRMMRIDVTRPEFTKVEGATKTKRGEGQARLWTPQTGLATKTGMSYSFVFTEGAI
jgi:hypothetical protein